MALLTVAFRITVAFVPIANKRGKTWTIYQRKRSALDLGVNGDASSTESDRLILVPSKDNNFLASAFAALDEKDQYDTVLMGLCAKILDGNSATTTSTTTNDTANRIAQDAILSQSQKAYDKLRDPISLLKEMNLRNVRASGRSLIALIDVRRHCLYIRTFYFDRYTIHPLFTQTVMFR